MDARFVQPLPQECLKFGLEETMPLHMIMCSILTPIKSQSFILSPPWWMAVWMGSMPQFWHMDRWENVKIHFINFRCLVSCMCKGEGTMKIFLNLDFHRPGAVKHILWERDSTLKKIVVILL